MKALLFVIAISLTASLASARTWEVREDSSGNAPTVQAGIDSASVSDTVLVGPGTYFEDIDFLGKDIVVKSEIGPEVTILDGSAEDSSVVIFQSGETRAAVLEGFTITGGQGTRFPRADSDRRGGGIWCPNGSPTIRGNLIVHNQADWGGGMWAGIANTELQPYALPEPLVEQNRFESNVGVHGGGAIQLFSSKTVIRENIFRGNLTLSGDGGGLYIVLSEGNVVVGNNQFWENVADDQGGGIHAYTSSLFAQVLIEENLLVRNEAYGRDGGDPGSGGAICVAMAGKVRFNTLVNNVAYGESECSGGGLRLRETTEDLEIAGNIIAFNVGCGVACRIGTATVGQNLLWANEGGDFGETCLASWGETTIFEDPLFCDPAGDDYTLAENSPALGMGAYPDAACGFVSIHRTTWGQIKTLYR